MSVPSLTDVIRNNSLVIKIYGFLDERIEKIKNWLFCRFAPINGRKIVFANFLGKGYGDNPKAITEEIRRHSLDWDIVWISKNEEDSFPEDIRLVKYGTYDAQKEMATAKVWVFNVRNFPHPKKRKSQVYIQTWHDGCVPFKKIEGLAEEKLSKQYISAAKEDGRICDYIVSSCSCRSEYIKNYFWISKKTSILECGDPKADILFDKEKQTFYRKKVIDLYGIDESKGVILYMPTFRDMLSNDYIDIDFDKLIEAFTDRFNRDFIVLFRRHPNDEFDHKKVDNERVIDVTSYPEAYELFMASDFGISDYTNSILLHMPLIGKPSFIYASDYEYYKQSRGLTTYYDSIPLTIARSIDELISVIKNFDRETYFDLWKRYFLNNESFDKGNASNQVVELLKSIIR